MNAMALPIASAHESQVFKIGESEYSFVVGSLNEPIFVDDKSGVDLRVSKNEKPVTGLEATLKVEVSAGDKKKTMDLSPAYNNPGAYSAAFYPTVATTYSYRFFGNVAEHPVDITFTCNPGGHTETDEDTTPLKISDAVTRIKQSGAFSCPRPKTEAGFPENAPSLNELKNSSGDDTAKTALGLSVVALVFALSGRMRKKS